MIGPKMSSMDMRRLAVLVFGWVVVIGLMAAMTKPVLAAPRIVAPQVVVTVLPLHSLVAGVMEGVGTPTLLIPAGASPHGYAMKPSDARKLSNADIIVWVGPSLETGLQKAIVALGDKAQVITLTSEPRIHRLADRLNTAFVDPHLWLDPSNAMALVAVTADVLAARDPANADRYAANALALEQRITRLAVDLAERLAPVRQHSFVTFHDAYQYFESRYGLKNIGFVVKDPAHPTVGVRHIRELRQKMVASKAPCVFTEPEYEPALIHPLIEGTKTQAAMLDHLGAKLGTELLATCLITAAQD